MKKRIVFLWIFVCAAMLSAAAVSGPADRGARTALNRASALFFTARAEAEPQRASAPAGAFPSEFSVSSWDEVYEALWQCACCRRESVTLRYSSGLALREHMDELCGAAYSNGVTKLSWRSWAGSVELLNLVYREHFGLCAARGEIIDYVAECADRGLKEFWVYMKPALAKELFADERRELEKVLDQSRVKWYKGYSYNAEQNCFGISDPEYYPALRQLSDAGEFIRELAAHADLLETEFDLRVTADLSASLTAENGYQDNLLHDMLKNNGIFSYALHQSEQYISLSKMTYYPGRRILYAWRNGRTDMLSEAEKRTLSAALEIAAGAKGSDLEREKAVHDALCRIITYSSDGDPFNNDDCAVGALLEGRADCDGYSDAFYLCGSLAGLDVRYQRGWAAEKENENNSIHVEDDSSHMWNLIRINGAWLTVDVTWDDRDEGKESAAYVYYNLGEDQTKVSYILNPSARRDPLAKTTRNEYRNPELRRTAVGTWEEIYAAVRSASESRAERISLTYPKELKADSETKKLSDILYSLGIHAYSWILSKTNAEICNIEYAQNYRICESEQEIMTYTDRCAARNISEFWLYFTPGFSEFLFENNMLRLHQVLARTALADPWTYSYNEDVRRVAFKNVKYAPARKDCGTAEVRSLEDVYRSARSFSDRRVDQMIFTYGSLLDSEKNRSEASALLYSVGIDSFEWGFASGIVRVINIRYHDEFRICDSRSEVSSYLASCRQRRVPSFRVYCGSGALYTDLQSNNARNFFDMLDAAGFGKVKLYHNDSARMLLTETE